MYFKHIVFLQPAEISITKPPCMITTVLGSCITLTMYDKVSKLSAMSHCVMPIAPPPARDKFSKAQFKFVDTTVEYMIETFAMHKVNLMNVEFKLFGGGNMIIPGESDKTSIGQLNIDTAKEILEKNNIKLESENTGGRFGRKLFFNTETGIVYLKTFSKII